MSKRTQKMAKVVRLAASDERNFGAQAGRSQQQLNEQVDRLGELSAFRHSYAKKSTERSNINAVHLQDYHNFLERLDDAARAQQQVVRDCEQNLDAQRMRWMVKRQRLESLEHVLEKCHRRDAVYQARLEQKNLDDLPLASNAAMKTDFD